MADVRFGVLRLQNFMSFSSTSFSFSSSGLHLVLGSVAGEAGASNGAGKSAISEGLCWALFGQTIRNLRADEVIRVGTDSCSVCLGFAVDGTRYEVARTRGKIGNSAVLSKFVDGAWKSDPQLTMVATNRLVERLLGFTFQMFKNTICHGQGLPYRFVQASDSEKKEIFDEILNLGWLEPARSRAVALGSSIDKTETGLQQKEQLLEARLADIETEQKTALLTELRNLAPVSEPDKAELEVAEQALKASELAFLAAMHKREQEAKILEKVYGKVIGAPEIERAREAVSVLDRAAAVLEAKLAASREVPLLVEGSPCPTCSRIVDVETATRLNNATVLADDTLVDTYRQKLEELQSVRQDYESMKERLQKYELAKARETESREGWWRKERDCGEKTASFRFRQQVSEHYEESRQNLLLKIAKLDENAAETRSALQGVRSLLEFLRSQASVARFWKEAFGNRGIRSFIIENVIPFMNATVKRYAELISDGALHIEFKAFHQEGEQVKEKFSVVVQNRDRPVGYQQSSGGERRRADIAVLLSLNDLIMRHCGIETNVLIFDEVFENLDLEGSSKVIDMLKDISRTKAVYVISHDNSLLPFFDNTIFVRKAESGISEIGGTT